MTGAFERVAELRGMPAPKPRRDHLRVVSESASEVPPATKTHRPVRLSAIIGQRRLTDRLSTHVRAALARGEQPGHILLDGPSGYGKTTLAKAISTELEACAGRSVSLRECVGDSVPNTRALAVQLAQLQPGDVLFVDECHMLPRGVQVALLRALEDRELFLPATCRDAAVRLPLVPFTLVCATTDSGKLSAALRGRFGFRGHLEAYEADDLALLLLEHAERASVSVDVDAAQRIAAAARFCPRTAIELLNATRDYSYEVTGDPAATIDEETARQGIEFAETDPSGLTERDLRVLRTLCARCVRGDPVGAKPLACSLGMDQAELTNDVEPFLTVAGYLRHLPRGRMATPAAYEVLGLAVPPMIAGMA